MTGNSASPLAKALTGALLLTLSSCGGADDSAKTKENRSKAGQLKTEADQLAAEAAMIQQRIRDYGSSDTTSAQIVETLLIEEKRVQGEGARLERLAGDLKLANDSLRKDQAVFGQKYVKP